MANNDDDRANLEIQRLKAEVDKISLENSRANLEVQKLEGEVKKLRLENSRSAWTNPAFLVTAGTLFVSLLGNASQYHFAERALQDSAQQIVLNQERWTGDRKKLEAEVEALKQNTGIVAIDRAIILSELDDVNRDIKVWEQSIFNNQLQLKVQEARLAFEIETNHPDMAEAMRKTVALTKDTIESMTKENAALLTRRADLEKRLGIAR